MSLVSHLLASSHTHPHRLLFSRGLLESRQEATTTPTTHCPSRLPLTNNITPRITFEEPKSARQCVCPGIGYTQLVRNPIDRSTVRFISSPGSHHQFRPYTDGATKSRVCYRQCTEPNRPTIRKRHSDDNLKMSTPAQGEPAVPPKEKKGIGKVLSRVKTVFRKADRRLSTIGSGSKAGPSSSAAAATAPEETLVPMR